MTMENTGYIALSHQMALQRQMEVIAHNIANANTTGFKADETLFESFMLKAGDNKELAYVQDFGVLINFREGPIERTGNPLDVALQGPGFLVVQTPTGKAYTRGGHLSVNARGELATEKGDPVLDDRERTIRADPQLGKVIINADGSVSVGTQRPAKLKLVEFENPQLLRRQGGGYFVGNLPEKPSPKTHTLQQMIEGSNVEPIIELAAMLETSRAYQASHRLIEGENDLQRKTAERLPQLRS